MVLGSGISALKSIMKRVMPPSASASNTIAAWLKPLCGTAFTWLSTITVMGRFMTVPRASISFVSSACNGGTSNTQQHTSRIIRANRRGMIPPSTHYFRLHYTAY